MYRPLFEQSPLRDVLHEFAPAFDVLPATHTTSEIGTAAQRRILANFAAFDAAVTRAEASYASGRLTAAAVESAMAACVATDTHCGIFASARLERLLSAIGSRIEGGTDGPFARKDRIERVLHVSTQVFPVGGHTRMIRRWVESDPTRTHSLALTQQPGAPPADLVAAITANGGQVHRRLNRRIGGLASAVVELRRLARQHDVVVLHIGNADVVPSLAFAQAMDFPPILFLNHADHLFWIGTSISTVVGGMREAAMSLAEHARHVEARRNVPVPILVEPTVRSQARDDAKRALGLDPKTVLLVSVARAEKYRTIDGRSYADLHLPLLERHPDAQLIVVGAGDRPDWDARGGRIQALTPRDPRPYFEAADIYLDSHPFCSATSMMEASSYGLPCVTLFVWPTQARICGMDHFGLQGPLIETSTVEAYRAAITDLIGDPRRRDEAGAAMLRSVERNNIAPGWCDFLESAYEQALALPPPTAPDREIGVKEYAPHLGEPDVRIEDIYGVRRPPHGLIKEYLSQMPLRERLRRWRATQRSGGFVGAKEALRSLLPEWCVQVLKNGY